MSFSLTKLNSWKRALIIMLSSLASIIASRCCFSARAFVTTAHSYTGHTIKTSRLGAFPHSCPHSRHCRRNKASRIAPPLWRQPFAISSSNNNETNTIDFTGLTVRDALRKSLSYLQESDAPEPEESVLHLLAFALNLPWSNGFVLLRHVMMTSNHHNENNTQSMDELASRTLTPSEATMYRKFLSRRIDKEPLQYILGQWDFVDYTFRIQPPLLCPRPETEELVLKVYNDIQQRFSSKQEIRILDVGCGTGVIGISLAAAMLLGAKASVTALDVEPIAVETTKDNAQLILGNHNKTRFQAILCSASEYSRDESMPPFDVIVSNPPYIPQQDMEALSDDVVKYESFDALCGGNDGMNVIRDIVYNAPKWGQPGTILWMEVDPTHPCLIKEWLDKEGDSIGVVYDSTHTDLYGRDRFVKLRVT